MSDAVGFIVNPASQGGRCGRLFVKLGPLLHEFFPGHELYISTEAGAAETQASKWAESGKFARVIVIGGDGTVHEVVNGLMRDGSPIAPELTLGVLPMGTGGDLVRSLGIPKKWLRALRVLQVDKVELCDLGRVDLHDFHGRPIQRYFINSSSFGLGGLTCLKVNSQSKSLGGKASFLRGVFQAALTYRNEFITLYADSGWTYRGPISNVSVANGRYCGGGMLIAPHGSLNNGTLQVVLVHGLARWRLFWQMPSIYRGKHLNHPLVENLAAREIEVWSKNEVFLELDGETPGKLPLKIKCLPRILRVNVGSAYVI